jgi:hypothetical protein
MLSCFVYGLAAAASAPVAAYIIDERLLTGRADDPVVQRILGDEADLPSTVLVLCAWQGRRCRDVYFDRSQTPHEAADEARAILATWTSRSVPTLDSLEGRFRDIYQSFDLYWQERGNHVLVDQDRRLSIVYVTNGDIARAISNPDRLREFFPTDGCIGDAAQGSTLIAQPPPIEARVEVRVGLPREALPLPLEAQRLLAVMAGYGHHGASVSYFGQSRLDCPVGNDTARSLAPLAPSSCTADRPSAPPETMECHAEPGGTVFGGKKPPRSPPNQPVIPAPPRAAPGGRSAQLTQSGAPMVPSGPPSPGNPATQGAPPTAPPSVSPPSGGSGQPPTQVSPPSSVTQPAVKPLPAPPPVAQSNATPLTPFAPAQPRPEPSPQPVPAMFTGARVITTGQTSSGGLLITWQAAAGASAQLRLQAMTVAPDGTVGTPLGLQQVSDSEIRFLASAQAGHYRVVALLPRPTAQAGNDCPERTIQGTLSVRGARLDRTTLVKVAGSVQGCAGDPAALLPLADFMVRQ